MQTTSFLLYGANGYTGELIARFAHQHGLQPILSGRNQKAIEALAAKLQLPFRVIDLGNRQELEAALREVQLVVHAAGPYDLTAVPMIEACIRTSTHYIDLNGDAAVFEMLQSYNRQLSKKTL